MEKLAVLVDPSKEYMPVVDYINKNWNKLGIDVWVGCSTDNGIKTADALDKLDIPLEHKVLFPGRLMQGVISGQKVGCVLGPRIVGYDSSKRLLMNAASQTGRILMKSGLSNGKTIKFGYLVLNGETSTVGRKVGAKDLTDEEAVYLVKKDLEEKPNRFEFLYVEAGSGAKKSIAERTDLLKNLKDILDMPVFAGGGIETKDQFKKVADIADCTVVGTVFEKDQRLIGEFYKEIC